MIMTMISSKSIICPFADPGHQNSRLVLEDGATPTADITCVHVEGTVVVSHTVSSPRLSTQSVVVGPLYPIYQKDTWYVLLF